MRDGRALCAHRLRASSTDPARAPKDAPSSHVTTGDAPSATWARRLLSRAEMSAIDRILPLPRLLEVDEIDLAIPPERVWELLRHGDLAPSPLARALFAIRTLPGRLTGRQEAPRALRIDALVSSVARPGFQVLFDEPGREVVVGAIGKVWKPDIPFVHVATAADFTAFYDPGFAKVAWAIELSPHGEKDTHVRFELRVDATDRESWNEFRAYFRLIGKASRFLRRSLLATLARAYGTPEAKQNERPLPGDDLLPDAAEQITHGVTMAATPEAIWPWLVQMGCRRGGFYSIDALDNGGRASAREIHPELQHLRVGDVLPATPEGDEGFEVLRIDKNRTLVLGGLYDPALDKQLPFASKRPDRFWQVTWTFALERLDDEHTRLHVRARAAFPASGRVHAAWIRFVHHFMEKAQLRHLAARVERRLPRSRARDVLAGASGAAIMLASFSTSFLRGAREHWGLDQATAVRAYPGDELVDAPQWKWTHGIEIDAPAADVFPWVAQIGADRAGFYSYQWLENLAGCGVRNAETIHPEWAVREGDSLLLHPDMPALRVVSVEPGKWFVAHAPPDEEARAAGEPWATVSWLFFVEALDEGRSRVISRYRCACSEDLRTQLEVGPTLIEPIGFAMDRRMLIGIKERAERAARQKPLRHMPPYAASR